jgi:hypothetical protein
MPSDIRGESRTCSYATPIGIGPDLSPPSAAQITRVLGSLTRPANSVPRNSHEVTWRRLTLSLEGLQLIKANIGQRDQQRVNYGHCCPKGKPADATRPDSIDQRHGQSQRHDLRPRVSPAHSPPRTRLSDRRSRHRHSRLLISQDRHRGLGRRNEEAKKLQVRRMIRELRVSGTESSSRHLSCRRGRFSTLTL